MKTHHLANIVLVAVMVTAVIGLYYMYKGPGMAIQQPLLVDTLGNCCCQSGNSIFKVPASVLASDEGLVQDCVGKCRERSTESKPVVPLGAC